jgi:DNA ligase-1
MQYVKIKSIKKINNPVSRYDIEVKDNHNYFANNILVHNCRLITKVVDGKAVATSRTGQPFFGLEHITDELLSLGKDFVIDGELYSDTLSFQEIMSVVRKSKSQDPRIAQIYLYAFDLINDKTYHDRVLELDYLVMGLKYVKIVPYYIVGHKGQILDRHKEFVESGYEGTMVRNLSVPYEINKRSYHLQKYKDFIDEEFIITGWKHGVGKFLNVPTFTLKTSDNKEFEGVPKGTEAQRKAYLENADSFIGKSATVRYFELTDDGRPRFPVITKIGREDCGDI